MGCRPHLGAKEQNSKGSAHCFSAYDTLIVAGKARVGTRSGHPKLDRFLCNHVVWCSSMRISPFPGLSVLEA